MIEAMPSRPTAYMLDYFHTEAIEYAKSFFHVILPSDPDFKNWREKAQYLLVKTAYVTTSDLNAAPHLLAIGKQGVGLDKIDVETCAARNIPVLNTPGLNAEAVAELALTLTMCVARRVRPILVRQANGEAVRRDTCMGLSLRGKTIGIVGMGNIGRAVAQLFKAAFGAHIVTYRPTAKSSSMDPDPLYTQVSSLKDLLQVADVVSLHVPLTPSTRNMISYEELNLMKPSAILINTSRGGIINEDDLARALEEGVLFGAGIDVHQHEPPTLDRYEKLWSSGSGNIVSLPHVGATTRDAQFETGKAAIDSLYQHITRCSL